MAREAITTYKIVDDITGERLNPNQAARVSVTIGSKVWVIDTAKASDTVKALQAAGTEQAKRGRKAGSTNSTPETPEAAGSPETPEAETETPEADTEADAS